MPERVGRVPDRFDKSVSKAGKSGTSMIESNGFQPSPTPCGKREKTHLSACIRRIRDGFNSNPQVAQLDRMSGNDRSGARWQGRPTSVVTAPCPCSRSDDPGTPSRDPRSSDRMTLTGPRYRRFHAAYWLKPRRRPALSGFFGRIRIASRIQRRRNRRSPVRHGKRPYRQRNLAERKFEWPNGRPWPFIEHDRPMQTFFGAIRPTAIVPSRS